MSNRWPAGVIRKTPVTPAGPYQDGAAPGVWTLAEATYWQKQGKWPIAGLIAQFIAVAHSTSPYVTAYPWSSGFGAKFTNPSTLPTGDGLGVAFSPAGDAIAVAHGGASPYITAYPWSSSGFGTKYANPTTLPTGTGWNVAFSPTGSAIAVAHTTNPYVTAYIC